MILVLLIMDEERKYIIDELIGYLLPDKFQNGFEVMLKRIIYLFLLLNVFVMWVIRNLSVLWCVIPVDD